tara:strand:- start:502 stop:1041 length:540 start_codon:yes stop_codon:yes gene_type:complete
VTHEEFVGLACQTARNAQGLRPLAAHVRQLYGVIRALQKDDNAFLYIAEVIQKARNDKSDAFDFMNRVKSYHHRDRKAVGDPCVVRGIRRHGPALTTSPVTEGTVRSPIAPPSRAEGDAKAEIVGERARVGPALSEPSVIPPAAGGPAPSAGPHHRDDLGALTAALHSRPGRRRIVSGG